ncbi:hypothetical protein REH81_31985, partial [Vibrio rotiferianus]
MSIVAFPERFKNYTEALQSNAVIKTNGSIDGIENLFDDMSTTGYYDSDDICDMFLKVLPEPYVVGALATVSIGTFFVSNRLISLLIDLVGDDRREFGSFTSIVQALAQDNLHIGPINYGNDVRAEYGDSL